MESSSIRWKKYSNLEELFQKNLETSNTIKNQDFSSQMLK